MNFLEKSRNQYQKVNQKQKQILSEDEEIIGHPHEGLGILKNKEMFKYGFDNYGVF